MPESPLPRRLPFSFLSSGFPPGKVHLEWLGLERGAEVEVGGDGKG